MSSPSLWERLKSARIVQVLLVYLGASWFLLQLVSTLQQLLALPVWVGPVTVIVLAAGLLGVLATAWVQSHPATQAREEAGEVPSDWQVAPADAMASLRAGRIPHLTWGRMVALGVVSVVLLAGFAGGYVLLKGLGPSDAGAVDIARGVAVLPFDVGGLDPDAYREGLADLVSTNLNQIEGVRAIDTRTVMAQWRKTFGDVTDVPLADALRTAGVTGARYALVGGATALGASLRMTATLYDLSNGAEVGTARVEGTPDEIVDLVDALSVDATRTILMEQEGSAGAIRRRLESITTASLPALEAYLEGERYLRRGLFPEAKDAFLRAVTLDTTFAMAYLRLERSINWLNPNQSAYDPEMRQWAYDQAARYMDRLPHKERTLVQVALDRREGRLTHMGDLDLHLATNPEDAEGWFWLAVYLSDPAALATSAQIDSAFNRTVDLDPSFSPYYVAPLRRAVLRGDSARFEELIALRHRFYPDYDEVGYRETYSFFWDDGPERARVDEMDPRWALTWLWSPFSFESDALAARTHEALESIGARAGIRFQAQTLSLLALGRLAEARDLQAEAMREAPIAAATLAAWAYVDMSRRFGLIAADAEARLVSAIRQRQTSDPCQEYGCRLDRLIAALLGGPLPEVASDDVWGGADRRLATAFRQMDSDPGGAFSLLHGDPERGAASALRPWYLVTAADAAARARDWQLAARYYTGVLRTSLRPYAHYKLGEVYEAMGDDAKAAEQYRGLLTLWAGADVELQPVIRQVQAAIDRLGG